MFSNKKRLWISIVIIGLLAVGGVYAYQNINATAETTDAPAMQTAKVRQGDLTLYASGTGTLIPAAEASFGFRSSGQLLSLSASVGEIVKTGQLLAELDNIPEQIKLQQAERALQELTSPAALAIAERDVAIFEQNLADALSTLAYQISPTVFHTEEAVADLQAELALVKEEAINNPSDEADAKVAKLENDLEYAEKIEKRKISLKRILASAFSISVVFELKRFRAYYAIIGLGLRHTLIMGLFSLVYVYMQKMGIPKHLLGIASIFNNITQMILITVCGILADKIGRKTLFVPGFFFSAIIPVIFMFSRTFLDFAIAFAFIGFSYSLLISGINPYIRDIAPKGKESEVLSLVNTTRAIGSIFGPIIAGAIVTCFSYEMMFVIFFIIGIIATIF